MWRHKSDCGTILNYFIQAIQAYTHKKCFVHPCKRSAANRHVCAIFFDRYSELERCYVTNRLFSRAFHSIFMSCFEIEKRLAIYGCDAIFRFFFCIGGERVTGRTNSSLCDISRYHEFIMNFR